MKNEDLYHYISHFGDFSLTSMTASEKKTHAQDFIFAPSRKIDGVNKVKSTDPKIKEQNKPKEFHF